MSKNTVSDTVIGPPQPSGADFYLPQRGAKSLDAAEIRIGGTLPKGSNTGGSGSENPSPSPRRKK